MRRSLRRRSRRSREGRDDGLGWGWVGCRRRVDFGFFLKECDGEVEESGLRGVLVRRIRVSFRIFWRGVVVRSESE